MNFISFVYVQFLYVFIIFQLVHYLMQCDLCTSWNIVKQTEQKKTFIRSCYDWQIGNSELVGGKN